MHHVEHILERLDHLVVQEIFLTKTAQTRPRRAALRQRRGRKARAPSRTASGAFSACRKAVEPPGDARDEIWIMSRARRAAGLRLGSSDRRRRLERSSRALAAARRDELRASRGARRHPVAVPRRVASRNASSSTRDCGTKIRRSAAGSRRSPSSIMKVRSSSRTMSIRSFSRPAAGSSRSTPACRAAAIVSPLHRGESLDMSPEDAERLGVDARRHGARDVAARHARGARVHRSRLCAPASCS